MPKGAYNKADNFTTRLLGAGLIVMGNGCTYQSFPVHVIWMLCCFRGADNCAHCHRPQATLGRLAHVVMVFSAPVPSVAWHLNNSSSYFHTYCRSFLLLKGISAIYSATRETSLSQRKPTAASCPSQRQVLCRIGYRQISPTIQKKFDSFKKFALGYI